MKNSFFKLAVIAAVLSSAFSAKAVGWPANYQGVMLQGFYWDSYNDSKWTVLESKADEYAKYFTLIWVPNSAKAASSPGMGYDPVYWFTNHTSSFGNEKQLRSMIETYKAKGVGIIEDVVVNHRSGVSNWYNFPKETWNGKTYDLSNGSICSTDEVWSANVGCPASYKGAADTGDDFGSSRDLDHTNTNVQNAIKDYCKFLLEDLGYSGFRLDMVKGYGGQYTKMYNQYAKPKYCVGEYWDGSYDNVSRWIEATGRESAAFDFPFKFQVNQAFANGDMTQLCWKANGTTDQPAGLIHYGYQQFAVTFIDNHDTYRESSSFNGNVVAANAFMLCSPGTPCVFLPHYQKYTKEIQALIEVRNAVGVHNMSAVKVLRLQRDCYMAEVTGTKGKLVVKIGSAMVSPDGYTDSQIKCSGTDYCVWATTEGGVTPTPTPTPSGDPFKVYFKNTKNWTTPYIHYWGNTESTYPGVPMTKVESNVWSYTVPAGTTGILFNAGDGDNTKTGDMTAVANHLYSPDGDQGIYSGASDDTGYPATLYLMGHTNGYDWSHAQGIPAKGSNGVYSWSSVSIDDADNGYGYFSFSTALGDSWDVVNASDRYGASSEDLPLSVGKTADIVRFFGGGNASSSYSWKVAAGTYHVSANLSTSTLSLSDAAGVEAIDSDDDKNAVFYNLQGVRVDNPGPGIYIKVTGHITKKVLIN